MCKCRGDTEVCHNKETKRLAFAQEELVAEAEEQIGLNEEMEE